jgi:carbonic anhydrase/acetyltransferase-like protein (isoleucine patch superfamily)
MLIPYKNSLPLVNESNFIAQTAQLIGRITLGEDANVWFGAVIRADVEPITIGARTNVQDNAVVHVSSGYKTQIGNDVTIGHSAIVHACTVGDRVLIGMGAIVLDGAIIGEETIIGAGALIPPGKIIPPRSMVMGSPGKVVRTLSDNEIAELKASAKHYVSYAKEYK